MGHYRRCSNYNYKFIYNDVNVAEKYKKVHQNNTSNKNLDKNPSDRGNLGLYNLVFEKSDIPKCMVGGKHSINNVWFMLYCIIIFIKSGRY